ncbi:rifin, partial [Plasmodium falciparum RAJ116]
AHNQRNHKKTILRTPKTELTKTHRSLCECELYAPSIYENDPEMKELMENFNHQTSERLREYDDRMVEKRNHCKDKCEKDIQKIILKDKIEKELTENFGALQTHIRTEDIPTCVCEKSLADKTEKVCLNCGKTMGAVAPAWGFLNGVGYAAWTQYVTQTAIQKGIDVGIETAIQGVKGIWELGQVQGVNFGNLVTSINFSNQNLLVHALQDLSNKICLEGGIASEKSFCLLADGNNAARFARVIAEHTRNVAIKAGQASKTAEAAEASKYTSTTSIYSTSIIASIVAIVVIVLVMVIIYLILHYRRKKKMKKKLQYIKLLKE